MPVSVRILCGFLVLVAVLGLSRPVAAQVFYTVTGPQGQVNWLLGTLHSADDRVLDWPPVLRQAALAADQLMLELHPDAEDLGALKAAMQLPANRSLDRLLGPGLFAPLSEALLGRPMSLAGIRRLRPWAALMLLSQPEPAGRPFMDMALASLALRAGAAVGSLESVQEQLAVLSMFDLETHRLLIGEALSEWPNRRQTHQRLVQKYLDGDVETLREEALDALSSLPSSLQTRFIEEGLTARNARMADRMQTCLDAGQCLVAVGALHLVGEDGLVERLRRRGWSVKPVY